MIRRAQAEALLKLAEALEECERNGLEMAHTYEGIELFYNGSYQPVTPGSLTGPHVRVLTAVLYPKSEGAE